MSDRKGYLSHLERKRAKQAARRPGHLDKYGHRAAERKSSPRATGEEKTK